LPDSRRPADKRRRLWRKLLELFDFAFEPGIFQCAVGDENQAVRLERLFNEIICAVLDRGDAVSMFP